MKMIKNLLWIFIGASLMTFSLINFIVQIDLASTGFTGIKIIIYQLTGMNPGLVGYLINGPLLLIFYKFYDKRTFLMTLYGMAAFNGTLWFFSHIGPLIPDLGYFWMILLGGAIGGLGVGLVVRVGGTTGGSHIVGKLANTYLKIPMARALLIFDAIVIFLSLYFFLTPINAVFTLITIFIGAIVTEKLEKLQTA